MGCAFVHAVVDLNGCIALVFSNLGKGVINKLLLIEVLNYEIGEISFLTDIDVFYLIRIKSFLLCNERVTAVRIIRHHFTLFDRIWALISIGTIIIPAPNIKMTSTFLLDILINFFILKFVIRILNMVCLDNRMCLFVILRELLP